MNLFGVIDRNVVKSSRAKLLIQNLLDKRRASSEEKIKAEIVNENTDVFTSESLMKKTYITNCIKESMRLHSPAWVLNREVLKDNSFKEYSWEKGTLIILYLIGFHRNAKYWKNPDHFIPERFDDENAKNFAYHPFGAGPRL